MTFLRWMGSKRRVVHSFADMFPNMDKINGYIECFLGGGSVFYYIRQNYNLEGKPIYLSDINKELIISYRVVRDNLKELVPLLEKHQKLNDKEYYLNMKKVFPPGIGMTDLEKAAAFIYLSHSTFGSQWGVNSKGKLTSSYRNNEGENIFNEDSLKLCSSLLQGTKIVHSSFENILKINGGNLKGWMTYFDPPYYDVGVKNYASDGFSKDVQGRIITVFKELDKRGVKVMMSNSDGPTTRLYFKNYHINVIDTDRASDTLYNKYTDKEREIVSKHMKELIVTNYKPIKKQQTMDDFV